MLRALVALLLLLVLILIPAKPLGAQSLTWSWTSGPAGAVVYSFITTPAGTLLLGTDSGGLFRSTDGGLTWQEADLAPLWPCCNYTVPSLAASASVVYLGTWGGGVCLSLNDGETWEPAGPIPDEGYPIVQALAACRFGSRVYAGGNFGVCRSEDGGASWTAIDSGLPTGAWVKSLALRGPILYAMMDEGVYRLDPTTLVWQAWNDGLPAVTGQQKLCPTATDLFLATHSGGPHRLDCADSSWAALSDGIETQVDVVLESDQALYAGIMGGGVFRCDPFGWYWNPVREGLWNRDVREMTRRGVTPYAGTYGGGAFELDLASDTWSQRVDGMNAPFVTSIVTDDTQVYVGTFGGGIYRSDDQGADWTLSIDGLDEVFVHCMAADASGVFAGTWIGVYKSTDQGLSWSHIGLDGHGVFSLCVDGAALYAGTYGGTVRFSGDGGVTWAQLGSGLPDAIVAGVARLGGVTYAALLNNGVYRLVDGGSTWAAMNGGLPELNPWCLAVGNGSLFVGLDGAGVCRWNPGTEQWDATGMTSGTVFCLTAVGGQLYAGSWGALYVSPDGGANWENENSGLKSWLAVRAVAAGGEDLYAGLNGGGVYRTENPVAAPESPDPAVAPGLSLRVEPNPSTPSTRVAFTLDRAEPVTVAVFDAGGRRVAILAEGVLPAGRHERIWDGTDARGARAAAGVYMIRLSAPGRAAASRLVLMP